ncbi:MAG: uracil-DNA glycosylase [Clostridia bacterium]|nr:uracil-DNA glycosylase [Clostridia bacterium]
MSEKLNELETLCRECKACELYRTRKSCVFGTGNESACLMFVGEAPGEAEDESGIPFVGAAGKLLDRYLYAVDIPRDQVYIANILKCRPPHNRDPLPEEQDVCIKHLRAQVKIIRPRIIVCLGRIAAMRLISPDLRITRDHGKWTERAGVSLCAVYHPAALLRDPSKKADMLDDMKSIKKKLDELSNA